MNVLRIVIVSMFLTAFASGCAEDNTAEVDIDTPGEQNRDDPSGNEGTTWSTIRADWEFGEVEEGACQFVSFTVNPDGRTSKESCGEVASGELTEAQMERIESRMTYVMRQLSREAACGRDRVADYAWTISVFRGQTADPIDVFYSDDQGRSCARGSQERMEQLDELLHEFADVPVEE